MARSIQVVAPYRPDARVRIVPTTTISTTMIRNAHRNAWIASSVNRSISLPLGAWAAFVAISAPSDQDRDTDRARGSPGSVRQLQLNDRYSVGQIGASGGHSPPASRAVSS